MLKRVYGLDRVKPRFANTRESRILSIILVLNSVGLTEIGLLWIKLLLMKIKIEIQKLESKQAYFLIKTSLVWLFKQTQNSIFNASSKFKDVKIEINKQVRFCKILIFKRNHTNKKTTNLSTDGFYLKCF